MDGAPLWETRWEESLRFAGILACAEGYLAYGCRVEAEENYPFAVCVDAQGAEVWRCEGRERGEVVAACVDGEGVLLLMDDLGGDGWPTRLIRLRAGAVVWQQDYPSARTEGAVTQGASRRGRWTSCHAGAARSSPCVSAIPSRANVCCGGWTRRAR